MNGFEPEPVIRAGRAGGVVRALVIEALGSTPREVGAAQLITADAMHGTIGGGALECDVITRARTMLAAADGAHWLRDAHSYHLGPELSQCCGGSVRILLEHFATHESEALDDLIRAGADVIARPLTSGIAPVGRRSVGRRSVGHRSIGDRPPSLVLDREGWVIEPMAAAGIPLVIYGAGHVGRAVVRALRDLPFAVHWIDVADDRFPAPGDDTVVRVIDDAPARFASLAPAQALHLVMTHSHTLDEAIVEAILRRGNFRYLGLIGSETKRARFAQRLSRKGFSADALARLHCPIGLQGLRGKSPAIIAASVAADLLMRSHGD